MSDLVGNPKDRFSHDGAHIFRGKAKLLESKGDNNIIFWASSLGLLL